MSFVWIRFLLGLALLLTTLWAFAPSLHNQFLNWDDDRNFLENPAFQGLGVEQIAWAWRTYHMGVWQPLAWVLLSVQSAFGGLDPEPYHLVSLGLHAFNAVVFYLVAAQVLRAAGDGTTVRSSSATYFGAWAAALLFAVHPLRVEAETWISGQPYLPAALFFMLGIAAYVHGWRNAKPSQTPWRWLVVSFACYLLAVGFKAVAVTLPAVLLILDAYPLRRWNNASGRLGRQLCRVVLEKTPFFVVAAFISLWAAQAKDFNETRVPFREFQPDARCAQLAYGLMFYPLKTLAPVDLIPYYRLPHDLGLRRWPYGVAAVCVGVITIGLVLKRRRWPGVLAAWLCYVVILFPNVGLVQISQQIAADRYSYLAMMPLMILLGGGVSVLWASGSAGRRYRRAGVLLAVSSAAVALGIATNRQVRLWHDSRTLWSGALRIDPRCAVAECMLGTAIVMPNQGTTAAASTKGSVAPPSLRLGEGAAHFQAAIRIEPGFSFAHTNLGAIRLAQNRPHAAIQEYLIALRRPAGLGTLDRAKTHAGLGAAYAAMGQYDLAWQQTRLAQRWGFPKEKLQRMIDALENVSPEPKKTSPNP